MQCACVSVSVPVYIGVLIQYVYEATFKDVWFLMAFYSHLYGLFVGVTRACLKTASRPGHVVKLRPDPGMS